MENERIILRGGNRITLPKQVCKRLKLKPGTVFELSVNDERIVLQLLKK